jgi:hypothetical protein
MKNKWYVSNRYILSNIMVYKLGSQKDCKTSDHILITNKHYQEKRNILIACFTDLRKAFDSVWRKGLVYKPQCRNWGELFRKLINNMYEYTSIQTKRWSDWIFFKIV